MKRLLAVALIAFGFATHANAQSTPSLDSLDNSTVQTVTITVACGDLKKANCAEILPHIAQYTSASNVQIQPVASRGSVQSAEGLCKGLINAAVGQHDAFAEVEQQTLCANTFTSVGHPLYPYFGYLIVAASNKANSLNDMVDNLPTGKDVQIADGKVGSGGQITFDNIRQYGTDDNGNSYQTTVSALPEDWTIAQEQISSGQLDGYFIMDAPGSPLIAQIKSIIDPNTKKPAFKFLDVRPGDKFYDLQDWKGVPLYQEVTINGGGWFSNATKTVSTWAELYANTTWTNSDTNEQAFSVLQQSADQADAAIRASTLTPKDWTGDIPKN
jgi:TRAP-type uncharacterized transport system substrate-binding protein